MTTFSLNIMVSAYSAATSNVTPRATKLVMEDSTTQNVLATFLGSFLFSLVGIIALSTGAYGDRGRVVLFVVTIAVIVLVVVTLLRWIDHLSKLGRVTETTARVEKVAADAMRARRDLPFMGGTRFDDAPGRRPSARAVHPQAIGYVQHLDVAALSKIADGEEGQVYVAAIPGKLVDPSTPLAFAIGLERRRPRRPHPRLLHDRRGPLVRPGSALRGLRPVGDRLARALARHQRSRHRHRRDRPGGPRAVDLGRAAGPEGDASPSSPACTCRRSSSTTCSRTFSLGSLATARASSRSACGCRRRSDARAAGGRPLRAGRPPAFGACARAGRGRARDRGRQATAARGGRRGPDGLGV